jgi:L-cysteine desulfidase
MGCTEPIALAYAGARARQILGALPEKVEIHVSGNIIKNVKSVIVPNTGGLHGIGAAVCAGIVAGDADKVLEVISCVTEEQKQQLKEYMAATPVEIKPASSCLVFDIDLMLYSGQDKVRLRIINHHTNIAYVEKNGEVLQSQPIQESSEDHLTDKSCLSIERIVEFADCVALEDIQALVGRQVACNMAIAKEGIANHWGANIGSVLLARQGDLLSKRAAAYAAAGSDARMSGCEMPVIILSGSGNQGITASVPVAVYARDHQVDHETYVRALALSNLTAIYIKQSLGRLSALCGCIVASTGASCAITYMMGGTYEQICFAVKNMIANLTGMICDGAKPSCSLKLSSGVSTAMLSAMLAMQQKCVTSVEGIIDDDVDKSIRNLTTIGKDAMTDIDKCVLDIMTNK